ncbi:serine protein kinase [Aspergillus novofumigatus IBT 16806]|uniref:non-specific serine/threonine protein kinase n=1 Tax=Aspergillus novofumigatus (strain IBT 16806) TaxID=1392255 RepID=A0A2I1CPU1_ASPN1|nr:serine protein kinase [Aspergillus novofumigatus IBT 16806]PKX99621.1 serine protein kinase [Aspergillus novofumigatus IBT 16806]
MRLFERIYDVVEPIEEYHRKGYQPLAFGQFSTVWLAHNQLLQKKVALKILKAEASRNNKELAMLLRLSEPSLKHPGKGHVNELLDYFEHNGPNGTHLCLVLPAMVSDAAAMAVSGKPHHAADIRYISEQILSGLDFLHTLGIIHCDLQPANILFSMVGLANSETHLQPPEFSPVRWLEGTVVDDSAPKYLLPTQRPRGHLDEADFSEFEVKIRDLGGAVSCRQGDRKPVSPRALRTPELIRRNTWDAGIDIWTLGCLVFELATNEPLFPLGTFGLTAEEIDQEHINLISQLLGEDDFGAENVQRLASFLSSMLRPDPLKRMSTTELLKHPFLIGQRA